MSGAGSTDEDGSLAARVHRCWAANDETAFYMLLYTAVLPRLCAKLKQEHGLTDADADDCLAAATDGFRSAAADGTIVDHPYAYLWRSVHNAAVTLHRQRKRNLAMVVDHYTSVDGQEPVEQAAAKVAVARWSAIAVEETLDDVEVEGEWAVELVQTALDRLPAQSQRVLRYLAEHAFDLVRGDIATSSEAAASDLGMTRPVFRKAKERAYTRLRAAIPIVAVELNLILPPRFAAAILEPKVVVPSPEDDVPPQMSQPASSH